MNSTTERNNTTTTVDGFGSAVGDITADAASHDLHQQPEPIRTLAFFDIETTGLPALEFNKTKITEISIVACSVEHLLVAAAEKLPLNKLPRVLHKISLCLNPRRLISPASTQITALDNFLLEHEHSFDKNTAALFALFLQQLQQPVCLVAHNGASFDFPLFKRQLNGLLLTDDDAVVGIFYIWLQH